MVKKPPAAAALFVALVAAAADGSPPAAAGDAGPARPNIVLVITDDQTLAQLSAATMPRALELLGAQGTTFANAFATTPLCCPSRASLISGQYGHNNGVLSNRDGYKGLAGKRNTLPVWLRRAGYRTAHVGRYLNSYRERGPAPGWQQWFTLLEPRNYFDYEMQLEHGDERFGTARRDYVTGVVNRTSVRLTRELAGGRKPFFLQVDHLAPHSDGIGGEEGTPCAHSAIPPSHAPQGFEQAELPTPPSFDEEDVSDKPGFITVQPRIDAEKRAELERQWRCRLASLPPVDAGIARIQAALDAAGELDDTAIILISDNGFFFGEHRVISEKYHAYEESIHVPLLIRFPASVGGAGLTVEAPVANIDVPATIVDLAGARPCIPAACRVLDGRSLVPLAAAGATQWPFDRAILVELDRRNSGTALTLLPCQYHGVRTADRLYVKYDSVPHPGSGECQDSSETEHYDLAADPFQLDNLAPAPEGSPARVIEEQLAARLAPLRRCAGIAGRDPPPRSGHYCE